MTDRGMGKDRCVVCNALDAAELAVFDSLLADPASWPGNVWGKIKPPPGLPGNYRVFGAVATGLWWLREHGYDQIAKTQVRRHYIAHVTPLPTPRELRAGMIDKHEPPIDPKRFLRYYAEGVEVGIMALEHLKRKFAEYEAEGKDIPMAYLRLAADLGKGLAVSQASIRAAGKLMHDEATDDDFRVAVMGDVSPRFGDIRVRQIEGEARPVVDRGRADRIEYNERADLEGSPRLPA